MDDVFDVSEVSALVRVRQTADKITTETAYYLLSRVLSTERFNQDVRQHWGIENSLHWRPGCSHERRSE